MQFHLDIFIYLAAVAASTAAAAAAAPSAACSAYDAANFIQLESITNGQHILAIGYCRCRNDSSPKTIYSIAPIEWCMTTWTVEMRRSARLRAWSIGSVPSSSMAQRRFKCSQNIVVSCGAELLQHSSQSTVHSNQFHLDSVYLMHKNVLPKSQWTWIMSSLSSLSSFPFSISTQTKWKHG